MDSDILNKEQAMSAVQTGIGRYKPDYAGKFGYTALLPTEDDLPYDLAAKLRELGISPESV